ncbi:LLM class F420-dependent oxidoreductase [Agromyces tropicus]|uniref:LLM class F420-dependent oxidoreductase n=1 Tax=Agromyces tropicus TaxID=555371 RepID=A0ABN2USB7_9MICO
MEFCITTEPQQGATYDDQLELARSAEALGFTGFFRSDHYMRNDPGDPLPGPTDAWTTLAGLARETKRIRLGTLMTSATHRVPSILAIQVAQVDAMSGGRVELGIGTGWFEGEHRAYGIPFPVRRFDRFEEQLEVITGLWRTPVGRTYSFDGRHYSLSEAPALPKPAQDSVPLIIGGPGTRRTPELAARFATEYNIGNQPDDVVARQFAHVRAACERIGRDPGTLKLSAGITTVVGETEDELACRAAETGETPEDLRNGASLIGDAAVVIERVERFRALGAERVYFQLMDLQDVAQVEYLGREVLPAFSADRADLTEVG